MNKVGVDLFNFKGQDWIVMVDQTSGFPEAKRLMSTSTKAVISALSKMFNTFGWPRIIRSDNGPQFRGPFVTFCVNHNITHETSSPHNPKSNGLAEAGVKSVKYLLLKTDKAKEDFEYALHSWRNTPREDGTSPAQIMFGRRQNTHLPTLDVHHEPINFEEAMTAKQRKSDANKRIHDKTAVSLTELKLQQTCLMQHHVTGKWDTLVTVTDRIPNTESYIVKSRSGKEYTRNRKFLHPYQQEDASTSNPSDSNTTPENNPSAQRQEATQAPVRRSPRLHSAREALQTSVTSKTWAGEHPLHL